jgi:hypothetical protein
MCLTLRPQIKKKEKIKMEENKVFWCVLNNGRKFNVDAKDIIDAVEKIRISIEQQDIAREEIFMIIDIPG